MNPDMQNPGSRDPVGPSPVLLSAWGLLVAALLLDQVRPSIQPIDSALVGRALPEATGTALLATYVMLCELLSSPLFTMSAAMIILLIALRLPGLRRAGNALAGASCAAFAIQAVGPGPGGQPRANGRWLHDVS